MRLDEAIKHCEEVAKSKTKQVENGDWEKGSSTERDCIACAEEHRQLAEWLKELKAYKEKETCETCGHYKAYQHGADITTMDDECGGCCSWNSKWIPKTCGDAISREAAIRAIEALQRPIMREESNYYQFKFSGMSEALDAVENLPSVTPQQRTGRWIPVSERLPEDHDLYMIIVKEKSTGYQYIPRIANHNYANCWSIIDTEDADKKWLDDLECIAWMPLPKPYKAESEK